MSHRRRVGNTASSPGLAAWNPPVLWAEPQAHTRRPTSQSGPAWQGSGSVDSTRPSTGVVTEGALLLRDPRPTEFSGWGVGSQLSLATGNPRVSPDVSSQEPGYTRGENPTAQPPGTNRLAGVLLRNRNSFSEPGFVQRPPHPRRADRASMGSERPSPSAQPAGPQGREPRPAPTGLTAVGAGREGPESSGQPCQFGPSPHHW